MSAEDAPPPGEVLPLQDRILDILGARPQTRKQLLEALNVVPATLDYVLARMMARKYVHLDFVSGRYHA